MGWVMKIPEDNVRDIKEGDFIIFRFLRDGDGHNRGAEMSVVYDFGFKKGWTVPDYETLKSIFLSFIKDSGDAIDFVYTWLKLRGEEIEIKQDFSSTTPAIEIIFEITSYKG